MSGSPIFGSPARPPWVCPRCGRVFESGFTEGDTTIAGHQVGDPRLCVPLPTMAEYGGRDARRRRQNRRGR